MKKILDKTMFRFIIVGVINTIVGTSVMFIAYNLLGAGYWIASALNYVIGSIVSYFLNKYYTFQNKEKSWKEIVYFVLNISVCYLLAYGIAKPVIRWALQSQTKTIQENIAMVLGMGLFVVLNYFGQRFLVFQKKDK